MVRAGCRATLSGFVDRSVSGLISMTWLLNRGSTTVMKACTPDPMPRQGEASRCIGSRRAGPAGHVIGMGPPECRSLEALLKDSCHIGINAANGRDGQLHVSGRLAEKVKEPPVDHLLGPKRDVGGGLQGVDVELGPARAKPGPPRDHAKFIITRRRRPRDVDAKSTHAIAGRVPNLRHVQATGRSIQPDRRETRVNQHRGVGHRLASRVEHAADDEHSSRCGLVAGAVRFCGRRW